MDKIRVLHLIQNLNIGGLERIAAQIAAGLDQSRFEAELWCLSGGGPLEHLLGNSVPVRTFDYKRYLFPGNLLSLSIEIRKGRFDIVHTHSYAPGIMGRISAKAAGIRIIFHHHHSISASMMNTRHRVCEQFVTGFLTDEVIACSEAAREFIVREKFVKNDKVTVIYNGVPDEFEKNSGLAEELKLELGVNDETVLTAVGSLTSVKGHIYLLEAVRIMLGSGLKVKLIIVGSGPEREALESRISEYGLSGSEILAGAREDVRPYLEIADIFVLPSLLESMSISSVEAMAKRLPVIASRTGGVTEVVNDGETGILVNPADPAQLAGAIEGLMKDRPARELMGEKGYARYRNMFTLAGMIDNIQGLYTAFYESKIKHAQTRRSKLQYP